MAHTHTRAHIGSAAIAKKDTIDSEAIVWQNKWLAYLIVIVFAIVAFLSVFKFSNSRFFLQIIEAPGDVAVLRGGAEDDSMTRFFSSLFKRFKYCFIQNWPMNRSPFSNLSSKCLSRMSNIMSDISSVFRIDRYVFVTSWRFFSIQT